MLLNDIIVGQVYRAVDIVKNQEVAVKILNLEMCEDKDLDVIRVR